MRYGKFLPILLLAFLAACSSNEPAPLTGTSGSGTGTGGTGGPGGSNGEEGSSGTVIVIITADSAIAEVGTDVVITASVWLDETMTDAVTNGTQVTFNLTGAAGVLRSSTGTTSGGQASVSVEGVESGAASVSATALGVTGDSVTVTFQTPGDEVRVSRIRVQPQGQSSVLVADSTSTNDEVDLLVSVEGSDGAYMSGVTVDVTTTSGTLSASKVVTGINGSATVRFTAGTLAGVAVITASTEGVNGKTEVDVGPGAPLQIEMTPPAPAMIGVRGSSAPESSIVIVTVKDKYGNFVEDNTLVNFELVPPLSGASLSPLVAGTIDGVVMTVINSGTKSGSMSVLATLPVSGRSVASNRITVFGGPISADRFEVLYTPGERVLPGFNTSGIETTISIKAADRYGNPAAPGTQIYATCEAGICGNNDSSGISTDETGSASFTFATAFGRYEPYGPIVYHGVSATPVNFGGYVGVSHTWPNLGDPKNGYVQIMAHAVGESAFVDNNANGIFEPTAVPVADVLGLVPSEPFLNRDDDFDAWEQSIFTPGVDEFHDFNGNGTFDALASFQEQQYVWSDLFLIYSTLPLFDFYFVPDQFIDANGDGIFDPNVDLAVAGGPITTTVGSAIVTTLTFPGSDTNQMYNGNYVTDSTTIHVYIGDQNDNPFPAGTKIVFDGLEDGDDEFISIVEPNEASSTYQGNEVSPKRPVRFRVKDSDVAKFDGPTIRYVCYSLDMGDIVWQGGCAPVLTF